MDVFNIFMLAMIASYAFGAVTGVAASRFKD